MILFHITDRDLGDEAVLVPNIPTCSRDRATGVYMTVVESIDIWASVLGKISPDGYIYAADIPDDTVALFGEDNVSNAEYSIVRVGSLKGMTFSARNGAEVIFDAPVKVQKVSVITGKYEAGIDQFGHFNPLVWKWIY